MFGRNVKMARGWMLSLLIMITVAGTLTPAQAGGGTRIRFERGATSTTVQGYLNPNVSDGYLLYALAGQTMTLNLVTLLNDVPLTGAYLEVSDANGNPLLLLGHYRTAWTGVLPASQTYQIRVTSVGGVGSYRLQVSIPSEIRFTRGATSAVLRGTVRPDRLNEYHFRAGANQWISLTVVSPADDVRLTLYGEDGNILIRAIGMPSNTWSGWLPATQKYFLIVTQPASGLPTAYTLYISIV
jgi:hypothetical protein